MLAMSRFWRSTLSVGFALLFFTTSSGIAHAVACQAYEQTIDLGAAVGQSGDDAIGTTTLHNVFTSGEDLVRYDMTMSTHTKGFSGLTTVSDQWSSNYMDNGGSAQWTMHAIAVFPGIVFKNQVTSCRWYKTSSGPCLTGSGNAVISKTTYVGPSSDMLKNIKGLPPLLL